MQLIACKNQVIACLIKPKEKEMKSNKIVSLMYVIMIAAMLLSACAAPATPAPTTVAPAAQATVAPKPAEPVSLNFWSMYNKDEPQAGVMAKAIDLFQKANPNVTINVVWKGRDVKNLALPALAAGEQIDMMESDDILLATKYKDYLVPISDAWLNQPSFDVPGKSVKDTILAPLFQKEAMNANGQMLSMPHLPYVVLFLYNKQQFTEAGITDKPKDMDELMSAFEKLKSKNHIAMTASVDAYIDLSLGMLMMRAKGCDAYLTTLQDKTAEAWKDPLYLQAFQYVEKWMKNGYLPAGIDGNMWPAGQQEVALGKATMELNGSWMPMEVKDSAGSDFKWGVMLWPTMKGGQGDQNGTFVGSQGIAITTKNKNPEVAWNFIKFLFSKQISQEYVKVANNSSSTEVDWTGPLADALPEIKKVSKGYGWACSSANAGDVNKVVNPLFRQLFVGKLTAQQFIDQVVKAQSDYYKTQK
jgi:raffinose/stachyose/melibiose transport system substrate-binding protein